MRVVLICLITNCCCEAMPGTVSGGARAPQVARGARVCNGRPAASSCRRAGAHSPPRTARGATTRRPSATACAGGGGGFAASVAPRPRAGVLHEGKRRAVFEATLTPSDLRCTRSARPKLPFPTERITRKRSMGAKPAVHSPTGSSVCNVVALEPRRAPLCSLVVAAKATNQLRSAMLARPNIVAVRPRQGPCAPGYHRPGSATTPQAPSTCNLAAAARGGARRKYVRECV